MSFWDLNDKSEKLSNDGLFESGGGDFDPIPAKTQVKAMIDEIKWDSYEGDRYINASWTVLAPEQYKNRKIFQKIRVEDGDSKKQDKAKRMLAAVAVNAGGGLLKVKGIPQDTDLQKHLTMKPMVIMLQVWKIKGDDGEEKSGNWISAVSPLKKQATKSDPEPEQSMADAIGGTEDDDDIGF